MPGHLGHEIGQRMRGIAATRTIPLLIMTAYHLSAQDKAQIEEAAHPEFLVPKPFPSMDDFQSLIENAIAASKPKPDAPQVDGVDPLIMSIAEHPGINVGTTTK
jgi:CheY-like chemotaxis protein